MTRISDTPLTAITFSLDPLLNINAGTPQKGMPSFTVTLE